MLDSADLLRIRLEEQKRKQEKKQNINTNINLVPTSDKILLIKKEDLSEELKCIDDFDETEVVKEILKNKVVELLSLNINSQLELGKIFEELFEELGKKGSKEGTYYKFLELAGYSKMTALRYRRKYKLFQQAIGEKSKIALSKLTFRQVETLYKNPEDTKTIIELLEEGKKIQEALALLPEKKQKDDLFIVEENQEIFDIKGKFRMFSKEIEKKHISEEKIEKISKLMEEIEKLINE